MSDSRTIGSGEVDAQPRVHWGRLGIAFGATIVLVIIGFVAWNATIESAPPPVGLTMAEELVLGSCVTEGEVGLEQYTVTDCFFEHQQQIVAEVDLARSVGNYNSSEALTIFVQEVCDRFNEYGLFIPDDLSEEQFELIAISVPTTDELGAGRDRALCAVRSIDGSVLSGDLYVPLP
ncbi:MAG: hypothetical protein LH471_00205 [Salinibacterium sp.]|nr:hypothetical protein [Salinibacterium sp.]